MGWNYLSIPRLQRCIRWSLGIDKYFHPTLYWACDYLSMVGLKLNHAETGLQGPVESCHYVIEGIKTAWSQRNHGSCLSVKTVCPGMKITITNKRRSPRRSAFMKVIRMLLNTIWYGPYVKTSPSRWSQNNSRISQVIHGNKTIQVICCPVSHKWYRINAMSNHQTSAILATLQYILVEKCISTDVYCN